jgi:alkylation response protein AidB-like acyl-CoA dehydrogenase
MKRERIEVSEQEAMQVAESARERRGERHGFLRDLFSGTFRFDLVRPFGRVMPERPEFRDFYESLQTFLRDEVDPVAIDAAGKYPPHVLDGLRRLGAFGMKIPRDYGGLGLSQREYDEAMKLLGSHDANVTALLSAHQSIGVPQPLKLFGTEAQKKRFLPRLAAGAISAFALTEQDVGSDPARLTTTIVRDGDHWVLNGEKLWCTNGTIAELLVVMARHPESGRISAVIVETDRPGVRVLHRCRFMGLRALENGVLSFTNVRVPIDNMIGGEGDGLKIALVTLNTGRLALPAAVVGGAKSALEICRTHAAERVQWGVPIGQHEAVAAKLADMAANTLAMEAMSDLSSDLADQKGYDIRLEAAATKEWNTVQHWRVLDDAMQIRGGRGYETELSLESRGETPLPIERPMRDARIYQIFEGTSEIMHLFIAREAVDQHLSIAGVLVDPKSTVWQKLRALPRIALFYALWYPRQWLAWSSWPKYRDHALARELRFIDGTARRLARAIFHGMLVHRAKLQKKQAFLGRITRIGVELYAMTAAVLRAQHQSPAEREVAALFCAAARRRIAAWFAELWRNDDTVRYRVARRVLSGDHVWLEAGGMSPYAPRKSKRSSRTKDGERAA